MSNSMLEFNAWAVCYLFLHHFTLELVGLFKALTKNLNRGTDAITNITQSSILQFCDLWSLICIRKTD